jgi:starch synthase
MLKVLMLASECVPFAKTGGIADVVGSLPIALHKLGVDVRVAMPHYSVIDRRSFDLQPALPAFSVPLDGHSDEAVILQTTIGASERESSSLPLRSARGEEPRAGVPVYFVDNPRLFARDGIYMYPDDAERFIFFCRAALEMCRRLDWRPDVVHAHDWQTAIVPNWLKTIYAGDPFFKHTASVYTIHNLAYQGIFGRRELEIAGLTPYGFLAHPDIAPDINQTLDFMARGILFGDALTTVSERYANEILTPEFGEKLDAILLARKDRLFGILNGIDYERFNPLTDPYFPSHYDPSGTPDGTSLPEARIPNKLALQRAMKLSADSNVPVIGMLSRLNDQKGLYLLSDTIEHILKLGVQFVLMGTGDAALQQFFSGLQERHPGRVAYAPTFNQPLAAHIFGGSDIYLMPSRFEPAGTNQMLALRFGAVPVVRATGGLADTVHDFDPRTGVGNGFTFAEMDAWALHAAVVRAVETYKHHDAWRTIQQNGMRTDLSWTRSAQRYVDVYQFAIEKRVSAATKQQALADDIARTAQVMAGLPARIRRLHELAFNLWWTWNPAAQSLFEAIDPAHWEALLHNPVKLLREAGPARIEAVARDPEFCAQYDRVTQQFDDYMEAPATWYDAYYPYATDDPIAYLSFEFGLHESLPIYSGGLGVLAGDMCKEASDLGVPLVAVGFLYPQGFFRQQIDLQGNQIALEEKVNFAEVPAVALRADGRESSSLPRRGAPAERLGADGRESSSLPRRGAPAERLGADGGAHLLIGVELPGRTIYAQLWRIQVGRVALIMMDTDIEQNSTYDRKLLAQLYQGDQEVRIAQEMILGIGAVRALRAAGIAPSIWHLNEGHGAFLALELLREYMTGVESPLGSPASAGGVADEAASPAGPKGGPYVLRGAASPRPASSIAGAGCGSPASAGGVADEAASPAGPKGSNPPLSFAEAVARVRGQTLFTTHTPVPAGNDAFPPALMDKYFGSFYAELGLSRDDFMNLALHDGLFSMTVLALRLTGTANAVSKLHGEVSRQMWSWVWPGIGPDKIPIRSITNGVHTATWLASDVGRLFDKYLGADWYSRLDEPGLWDALAALPGEELWATHNAQRLKLVLLARSHAHERALRLGIDDRQESFDELLSPDILTLGFARRFATYKRATLIFRDVERLKRLLNDPQRPVQIILSGKSHPADMPGKEFIRQVYQFSQADGLRGRILFMEEYNIHTARSLVAGVDVWLNNPRRPLEASGTSGMKASLNGIPTASILDGWWAEGYNGANGWAIGSTGARAMPEEQQDAADAESLYTTLEQQIVPLFYRRDERGIPHDWLKVMKEAIRTIAPQFSARRMVKQYVQSWVEAMAKEGAV